MFQLIPSIGHSKTSIHVASSPNPMRLHPKKDGKGAPPAVAARLFI